MNVDVHGTLRYGRKVNILTAKVQKEVCFKQALEEKTRKAVGENLENLFSAYNKYSAKLDYLSSVLPFDYAAVKLQLTDLYENYKTVRTAPFLEFQSSLVAYSRFLNPA